MQLKSNSLAEEASKIRLQVNIEKTEMMKLPGQQQQQQQHQTAISINGRNLKETTSFTYLTRKHRLDHRRNGEECQSEDREGKVNFHYSQVCVEINGNQHEKQDSDLQLQCEISQCYYMDQRLALRVTKATSRKLLTFINNCLRSILKIRWPGKTSNRDLWEQTNQEPITQQICRRKWRWIGHTLRKPSSDITLQAKAQVEPEWEAVASWPSEGDMEELM